MTREEARSIARYLERTIVRRREVEMSPADSGRPGMVRVDGEFIGTVDKDVDVGEVSYALTIPILAEDLTS